MGWSRGSIIGHGSSAAVSLATSHHTGQVFAVKTAELAQSQLLKAEQKILSSLNHPCIVGYRGCDISRESGKNFYNIFMELATEGTLADEIHRRGGQLNESAIGFYTRQILQGLEYLHTQSLVHCDIKSRNILICDDGAKIADFGYSKRANEAAVRGGTPMFMAPEVVRGEAQGPECDIWALGCTVIEMATGSSPLSCISNHPLSVLYRVGYSGESPVIPRFLSDQGKDFLEKCLRKNPKERWTASQLLNHSFVEDFNCCENRVQNYYSNSPTSILEQNIWGLSEEFKNHTDLAADRIRRLSVLSGELTWKEDENWIGVRGEEVDSETENQPEFSENNNFAVNYSVDSSFSNQSCEEDDPKSLVYSNSSFL